MELVLMRLSSSLASLCPVRLTNKRSYLQISKLRELLPAVVKSTDIRLRFLVRDLVGTNVPPLGEPLVAYFARKGFFSSVTSFVSL